MKSLWKLFGALVCLSKIFSVDLLQHISEELLPIINQTESIYGHLDRIVPLEKQGGSFINEIYLGYTDQAETFILKVENPFWKNEKTINEVITLNYLNQYTSIPAPKVLAYKSVSNNNSPLDREYILMTHIKGSPLNHEFEKIYSDPNLYQLVLEQLADVLAELRRFSFSEIGGLKCSNTLELKNPVELMNLRNHSPCTSFSQYGRCCRNK